MYDEVIKLQLRDKEVFDRVVPKAILRVRDERSRPRQYLVMALRLGHVTGQVVKWKDIAAQTYNIRDKTITVSSTYCQHIYKRGLRLCRIVIELEAEEA